MDIKAFKFESSGFEYFKIWIVNFLLTIVTLVSKKKKDYVIGHTRFGRGRFLPELKEKH